MGQTESSRYTYRDVTGRLDCTDASVILAEASRMLANHHPDLDLEPLRRGFGDLEALYQGHFPGFRACDMSYHDLPHVLDVSLALIRLLDGYQHSHRDQLRLSGQLCLVGILVALFHDSGYIRRRADRRARNGAEYTRIHVSRSARFLKNYLREIGYADFAALAARLVQFTGYEIDLSRLTFSDPRKRRLGELIGTADILAQMSDRAYLDKCRDCLYPEFVLGGVDNKIDDAGERVVIYRDAVDLLHKTPGFIDAALGKRLSGSFRDALQYVEVCFDGKNPYLEAILANRRRLQEVLDQGRNDLLLKAFNPQWRPSAS